MFGFDLSKEIVQRGILREIFKRALIKKGLSKLCANVIEDIYERTSTRMRILYRKMEKFSVRLKVYQGSALSLCSFSLIMDEIKKDMRAVCRSYIIGRIKF